MNRPPTDWALIHSDEAARIRREKRRRFRRRFSRDWWLWFIVAAVLATMIGTYLSWRACDGRLVRGLFWWECIRLHVGGR